MSAIFNGNEVLYNKNGEAVPVKEIIKTVSPYRFWKVNMIDFLNSLGLIGGKAVHVYSFILSNISKRTNQLNMSNKDIQNAMKKDGINVSYHTVASAIAKLSKTKVGKNHQPFVRRVRYGRYGRKSCLMLNPELAMFGKGYRYTNLLVKYRSMSDTRHNERPLQSNASKYKIKSKRLFYTANGRQDKNKRRSTAK